jgi:HEAT repeat protein
LGPKASTAVRPLISAADGADPEFRTDIHFALAAIGPAAAPATELLANALNSEEVGERESALYALRQIGPAAGSGVQPLTDKMNADDSFDAIAAAWALARIAPNNSQVAAEVVKKLTVGLSHADEQVRLESVAALAELGPAARSAAADLERVTKEDHSPDVRSNAEAALQRVR